MNDAIKDNSIQMTVLCVDDESNILKSLKRLLYKQNFTLLLAESGQQALELLGQNDVHLVMSDMKMPQMSGAELLEKVATHYPNTYRILLTGYADVESTIDAVNKGKIHKYLQKPWDNDDIIEAVNEGLNHAKVKLENIRLNALVKKQNSVLKELNHNLEDKVQLRTKQIRFAMRKIERNNNATQKVLYNFISINPNLDGGFANSVSLMAKRMAEILELTKEEVKDITYAALLCEVGLLGLDPSIYTQPFNELKYNLQQEYIQQTEMAQLILSPATHLHVVSDILTYQFECCDGSGPNKLDMTQIPTGAKILAVARDFWRYSLGRITGTCMDHTEVRTEMKKHQGKQYDPQVLAILLNNPDIISDEFIEKSIASSELKSGMVLKYNLLNDEHILLLPEGHVFSETTITKLKNFEKSLSSPLALIVEETEF